MDRKSYWNEKYYEYWKSRVDEASENSLQSKVIANDSKTEDDETILSFMMNEPFNRGNVLEVGCAWGRLFHWYQEQELLIHAVDISQAMIDAAMKNHSKLSNLKSLQVAEAEELPYESVSMDNLVCLAVFDATYQEAALAEFCRILKPGGKLYFTGKNNHYHRDDQQAWDAEFGAASKNHPNYFTDTKKMLAQLKNHQFEILHSYYFERRGDFAMGKFSTDLPDRFYEYFLILQKKSSEMEFRFESFSKVYSENAKSLRQ